MKAQTSYLDLEERNGLVYEIGTANLFTGLVNVPLMHFFPDFYDLEEAPSKAKGKEFFSSFLFTYEEAPMVCGVDSILDLKPTRTIGKDLLEDFVCEFRYKSGLKHGILRELMLSGMGWGGDGGYWNKVKGLFIEGKFKQIALYGFDNKLEERGSCSENFLNLNKNHFFGSSCHCWGQY